MIIGAEKETLLNDPYIIYGYEFLNGNLRLILIT